MRLNRLNQNSFQLQGREKGLILVKAFEEPNNIAKLTVHLLIDEVCLLDFDTADQLNEVLNKKKQFKLSKVLITTIPFGDKNPLPLELLEKSGIEYLKNPFNKKITEDQLADIITDFDVIIAGTEPITEKVLNRATNLKLIPGVGIRLDNVDLLASQKRGIKVYYTQDAP